MKAKIKYKFPCGYEIEFFIRSFMPFGKLSFTDKDFIQCPMHKDKCKRATN